MISAESRSKIISWEGIQIVENVVDGDHPSVDTLDGRIGPLLKGETIQAHFIEMPGDLFCEEHPHATESLIFTVKGRWVLCSSGRRHLMKPGSLFWFEAGTPTGYEVPFQESAFILIFKARDEMEDAAFLEYLLGLKQRLEQAHQNGIASRLSEHSQDHPSQAFARSLKAEEA